MNQESLKKLAGISDIEELRRAVAALCLPFGSVREVRLLPDPRGDAYLCFVTLVSQHMNPPMMDKLGGINYGNSIAFRIPFKPSQAGGG